jgi:hypothetical protein
MLSAPSSTPCPAHQGGPPPRRPPSRARPLLVPLSARSSRSRVAAGHCLLLLARRVGPVLIVAASLALLRAPSACERGKSSVQGWTGHPSKRLTGLLTGGRGIGGGGGGGGCRRVCQVGGGRGGRGGRGKVEYRPKSLGSSPANVAWGGLDPRTPGRGSCANSVVPGPK